MRAFPLVVMLVTLAGPVAAQTRAEIPIREVPIDGGQRRYTVMVKVGSTQVEAGLDTGSTGLRVLPGTLAAGDAKDSGDGDTYSYQTGTQFEGTVGSATLALGAVSGSGPLQLIKTMDCRTDKPDCPASKVDPAKFGIQGNGLPGRGFRAIIGINMGDAHVGNPLLAMGVKRWIVRLPREGDTVPGALILNPDDAELTGFARIALEKGRGEMHDAINGCLASGKDKACGALVADTGAPGIQLVNGGIGDTPWPRGTAMEMGFYGEGGTLRAGEALTVGVFTQGSRLTFQRNPRIPRSVIFAGLSPYFAFDVLYDPDKNQLGLKPRPAIAGAPAGQIMQ